MWASPRTALALLLATGAGAVVAQRDAIRQLEAWSVARIAGLVLQGPVDAIRDRPIIRVSLPAGGVFRAVGILVTPECTAAWLIAPILLTAAAMALGRRLSGPAVIAAAVLTGGFMLLVNVIRLTVIVAATHRWGLGSGYKWSHEIYGSLITVAGVALGLFIFARLVVALSPTRGDEPA